MSEENTSAVASDWSKKAAVPRDVPVVAHDDLEVKGVALRRRQAFRQPAKADDEQDAA